MDADRPWTPGEYRIVKCGSVGCKVEADPGIRVGWFSTASIFGKDNYSILFQEAEANAQLHVAAPKLYEALEDAVHSLHVDLCNAVDEEEIAEMKAQLEEWEAALNAANPGRVR